LLSVIVKVRVWSLFVSFILSSPIEAEGGLTVSFVIVIVLSSFEVSIFAFVALSILRVKSSLPSPSSSAFIVILTDFSVSPAGIVKVVSASS